MLLLPSAASRVRRRTLEDGRREEEGGRGRDLHIQSNLATAANISGATREKKGYKEYSVTSLMAPRDETEGKKGT